MEDKQYWPEHKVFFIATLALFPARLIGVPITEIFYKPYFPRDEIEFIEMMLDEYRKNDYIEYKNSDEYVYKITEINTQKAKSDLKKYLKAWQQNKLEVIAAHKPPDLDHLQDLLNKAITQAYAHRHQEQPRITLLDIFGSSDNYDYRPPFWELVLSFSLLDQKADVLTIGYDRSESYIYKSNSQPFIEYKITDKVLLGVIKLNEDATPAHSNNGSTSMQPITLRSYDTDKGKLYIGDKEVDIIRQDSRRGKPVGETAQGRAMRLLFKDVNTLHNGVEIHKIISVNKAKFDSKLRKRATNHLDEINRKIKKETGIPKLINYSQVKYYVDKSYL